MNIKEKIQKSFKPCKRLKLLEYSEFLEKEELNDSPTSRAMYCEYKSQVDEKNQKADLCLSQKIGGILFAIVLTIVIICLFINQVSATVYMPENILENAFSTNSSSGYIQGDTYEYPFNDYGYTFKIFGVSSYGLDNEYSFCVSDIESFQGLCEYREITTYSQWQDYVRISYPSYDSGDQMQPLNGYYITSDNFDTLLTYKQYTQTDIENSLKQGYQRGINDAILLYNEYWRPKGYETYPDDGNFSTLVSQINNIGIYATDEYNRGINTGLLQGKIKFMESQEYQDILADKYQEGYTKGEETAPLVESSLRSFFNAPINFISNILNFEIFGINLWAVFTFILTLGLIFFIIKKVVGL